MDNPFHLLGHSFSTMPHEWNLHHSLNTTILKDTKKTTGKGSSIFKFEFVCMFWLFLLKLNVIIYS